MIFDRSLFISKKLEKDEEFAKTLTPLLSETFDPEALVLSFKPFEHDAYVLGKVAHRILSESADNYIRTLLADA